MNEIHPEFANRNLITGLPDFQPFPKLARLNREIVITEKLDGTNAQIYIGEDGSIRAGSRNRWITPSDDNYGFARWCNDNFAELLKLGPGRHFGEWWGAGIQRNYGLKEKRFSLFNVHRWKPCSDEQNPGVYYVEGLQGIPGPNCCHVVPTLWRGNYDMMREYLVLSDLRDRGSVAAPGFMDAEGIVIFHTAAGQCFKVTLKNDDKPKSLV